MHHLQRTFSFESPGQLVKHWLKVVPSDGYQTVFILVGSASALDEKCVNMGAVD